MLTIDTRCPSKPVAEHTEKVSGATSINVVIIINPVIGLFANTV